MSLRNFTTTSYVAFNDANVALVISMNALLFSISHVYNAHTCCRNDKVHVRSFCFVITI